jgi:hypothetical protein
VWGEGACWGRPEDMSEIRRWEWSVAAGAEGRGTRRLGEA